MKLDRVHYISDVDLENWNLSNFHYVQQFLFWIGTINRYRLTLTVTSRKILLESKVHD